MDTVTDFERVIEDSYGAIHDVPIQDVRDGYGEGFRDCIKLLREAAVEVAKDQSRLYWGTYAETRLIEKWQSSLERIIAKMAEG